MAAGSAYAGTAKFRADDSDVCSTLSLQWVYQLRQKLRVRPENRIARVTLEFEEMPAKQGT